MVSLRWLNPQPASTTKWATTLKYGKVYRTTNVTTMQNPQHAVKCKQFIQLKKGENFDLFMMCRFLLMTGRHLYMVTYCEETVSAALLNI